MGLSSWRDLADALLHPVKPLAGQDSVTLRRAAGRFLAEDVNALRPIPATTHAVMDGYALGASPPGLFTVREGIVPVLAASEACRIRAGQAVPEATALVVLASKCSVENNQLRVDPAQARDNVRRRGEEAAVGDIILASGTRLDARHISVAGTAGLSTLPLRRRPRIALVTVDAGGGSSAQATVLEALLTSPALNLTAGGCAAPAHLSSTVRRLANRHDLVLIAADSLDDVGDLRPMLAVHRPALKPAKPVLAGQIGAAHVIGLSGTAFAVTIAAHLFVRPMLLRLLGLAPQASVHAATVTFARQRQPGRAEALPVRLDLRDGTARVASAGRFGQITALAAMDGFALIEAESADLQPGAPVLYHPLLMPLV